MRVKFASVVAVAVIACLAAAAAALAGEADKKESKPISIGTVKVIPSRILGEDRAFMIHLPPGYELGQDSYPVLILLDGPQHFGHAAASSDYLAIQGQAPGMIVAGVVHKDRTLELSVDQKADKFLDFLQQELIPRLEADYRVAPYRIVAGHSLGGQLALHALITRPELFDAYFLIGPSLAWKEDQLAAFESERLPRIEAALRAGKDLQKHLFISLGEEEGPIARSQELFLRVLKKEAPRDLTWQIRNFPDDTHGTLVPPALYDGLRELYRGWLPAGLLEAGDLEALEAHYAGLTQRYGYPIPVPELLVNLMGYMALEKGDSERALAILAENARVHPASANVYDSLGEALEKQGRLSEALANYERACQLGESAKDPNLKVYLKNQQRVRDALGN